MFPDEPAFNTQWNVPEAHPLESWGDARAFDGTVTIMQPLIAPLYDGRTATEGRSPFVDGQGGKSAHDLVKDYWTRAHAGQVAGWTITDPTGQPFKSADSMWRHVLHDGWVPGTGAQGSQGEGGGWAPAAVAAPGAAAPRTADNGTPATGGFEIIFR